MNTINPVTPARLVPWAENILRQGCESKLLMAAAAGFVQAWNNNKASIDLPFAVLKEFLVVKGGAGE